MQIGIISEGHSDRAVIANLFTAATGIDRSSLKSLRPILKTDATDRAAAKDQLEFSNWTLVRKECLERELIDEFLSLEGNDYIIIHLDTAEAEEYEVRRPIKDKNYALNLRTIVVEKIQEWLKVKGWPKGIDPNSVLYAVAVEETESWLLCIYWNSKDTSSSVKPKEKLNHILSQKKIDSSIDYQNYIELSKLFAKHRDIIKGRYLDRNASLALFYAELQRIAPKKEEL